MTVTVATLVANVAVDLQEDTSFSSNLWSIREIIGYVNYAEMDFLRRTGIIKIDRSILTGAAPSRYDDFIGYSEYITVTAYGSYYGGLIFPKPDDMMDIERVSFNGVRLRRQTAWDLMRENPNWRNQAAGPPRYYHEDQLPINTFEVDRLPSYRGTIRILGDWMPVEHVVDESGQYSGNVQVPDCWEPYIRWEVLSLALAKDGDGQDLVRSKYAHDRYMFGVNLALRLVMGSYRASIPAIE